MKQQIKNIINNIPVESRARRVIYHLLLKYRLANLGNVKDIFTHHYKTNYWGSKESRSGAGSTVKNTENIRKEIPQLLNSLGIKIVLDVPCGDYNWFKLIPRGDDIIYIGGDIVEQIVNNNQEKYGDRNTKFVSINIINDKLPNADLWLCRDCLFHLSNENIYLTIANFLRSDIRYLLTSIHSKCNKNKDITTGSFRLLNLELPPFNFGRAVYYIEDWAEGFPGKQLALWERNNLEIVLASNREFLHAAGK